MELFKPGNDTYFTARPKPNVRLKPSDSSFYLNLSLEWSLTFEHPYDEEGRWKLIEGDSVILIESPFHVSKQAFVVNGIEKGLYSMTVTCHHYFIESAYEQVMDRRAVNAMPQEALDVLFEGTEFRGKAEAGFTTENSIYFFQDNILNFIKGSNKENTLHNRWGGEFFYDNRTLKWYESLNKDKIFKISFGQNLTDLGLEEDWKGVYTRIYPKAYNGRLLSVPHYVDSPNITKYAKVKATWLDFDDIGLKTDYEHYNPDSPPTDITLFETVEELEAAIRERIKKLFDEGLDLPTITGTVNAAMLHNSINREGTIEVPGLGYTIKAYNKLTNMEYQSRIIGIDWNTVKHCFNSIELGDAEEAKFFEKIESTVDKVVDDLEESNKTDWNQVIKDTMDELTDYINNGTYYGNIKITKQEFLILDDEDINKARKVWRWNMGGLGFSTNGYAGPFQTAITAAGKMLINELTAETIRASMIKAGTLSSLNNECWINLDKGTFNFADKIKWNGHSFEIDLSNEGLATGDDIEKIKTAIKVAREEISLKVDKGGIISAINLTPEQIKINASKINLQGYVTISNLKDGRTVISGDNIQTGTISAVDIYACTFRGKNMVYIEDNGTLSCDGTTYIRHLSVLETHPGWAYGTRGSFDCAPTANFKKEVRTEGEFWAANNTGTYLGVIRRGGTGSGIIQIDRMRVVNKKTNSGANNYLEIAGYNSDHVFGADLWSSDITLKENIVSIEDDNNTELLNDDIPKTGLDLINSLNHYAFDYKENLGGGHVNCGYVAQELQELNDSLVMEIEQQDGTTLLQPKASNIIPNLSLAIKQQQKMIETLKAGIEHLKTEVEHLKSTRKVDL